MTSTTNISLLYFVEKEEEGAQLRKCDITWGNYMSN